jgi:8-oxo-dGTP pyrophosphatase MutT (NUDIX family)
MLDLKPDREPSIPKDAATIVLARDSEAGLEIFCVERSKQSRFLGGAIVFPGGKLDPRDTEDLWATLADPFQGTNAAFTRSLAVAACRETLEEASILLATGPIEHADLVRLRAEHAASPDALRAFLAARGLRLALGGLHPLARWITPQAEARRYDTRFFLAIAPDGQLGAHDEHETMASFWATPDRIFRRWEAGEVMLAPPTHRTLQVLAGCRTTEDAVAVAKASRLDPICPSLVRQEETVALTLPGDPEHEVRELVLPGRTRYVLRGERWVDEDAPR